MFVRHHPLEGKRQLKINVFNEVAQREFYGNKPVFLFDATDKSNQATKGFHDSAIRIGISILNSSNVCSAEPSELDSHNPDERVKESEWISGFSKLRDSLIIVNPVTAQTFSTLKITTTETTNTVGVVNLRQIFPCAWRLEIERCFVPTI